MNDPTASDRAAMNADRTGAAQIVSDGGAPTIEDRLLQKTGCHKRRVRQSETNRADVVPSEYTAGHHGMSIAWKKRECRRDVTGTPVALRAEALANTHAQSFVQYCQCAQDAVSLRAKALAEASASPTGVTRACYALQRYTWYDFSMTRQPYPSDVSDEERAFVASTGSGAALPP